MSSREFIFQDRFHKDVEKHKKADKRLCYKVLELIASIDSSPFEGKGHPEPLRHELSGFWSRQIDKKHRLIYLPSEDGTRIDLVSCFGHYDD